MWHDDGQHCNQRRVTREVGGPVLGAKSPQKASTWVSRNVIFVASSTHGQMSLRAKYFTVFVCSPEREHILPRGVINWILVKRISTRMASERTLSKTVFYQLFVGAKVSRF